MKPQISILLLCALLINSFASPEVGRVSAFMQEEMTPTPTAMETPTDTPLPSPTPEETPTPTATDTIEPTASATETPAPSETPMPTIIETETPAPTPSETPFITPTYTGTPSIAPTNSETPTLVPTISETPTSTPFISETPTATPTFTPTPSGPIRLVLKSDPPYLTGTTVSVQCTIEGMQLMDVTDSMELLFHFSAGISPAGEAAGVLNSESMSYSLQVKESYIITDWKIEPEAESPFYIEAELRQGKISLAKASLMLQERYEMKKQGGELSGLHGRVVITFPPEALSEDAFVFIHRPRRETTPPYTLSGHPFEITASGSSSRLAIKNFDKWIKIQVAYDEANLPGPEGDLTLFWYDWKSQSWHPLPSHVDMKNHVLVAHTDHLTVLDVGVQDWQAARLPYVEAFQVSTFTGAATYSMDFNLPAGPGGLQPSLTLSYNSLVIDQASANTQASWVGMGWSLDTAYVERNMHGTDFDLTDDSYSINLNGVSGMLLQGDDGYYHTTEESFYRIQYDVTNNSWKVWDKTGTLYAFGHASYYGAKHGCEGPVNTPWRWSLTRVRNIFGQELVYHYVTEDKEFHYYDCNEVEKNYTAQLAVYPDTIDYPNSRYRVIFTRNTNREDYDIDWEDPFSAVLYQRSSLDKIFIREDSVGDGSFATLVRKYVFTYETDQNNMVLPSITWTAGGGNLTLTQVQEFGKGGTDGLPATSFTYGDVMHLTRAENGYGGAVEFSYETDPWHDVETSESRTNKHLFGNSLEPDYEEPCEIDDDNPYFGDPQGWAARDPDLVEYVYCYDGRLLVFREARNARLGEKGFFKPGSYYNIYAEMIGGKDIKNILDPDQRHWGTHARIGLYDGYNDNYHNYSPLYPDEPPYEMTEFDETFYLRPDAKKATILLDTDGAKVSKVILKLLPTFYRVLEKKLYDGNGNVFTFTYTYTGPATNNPTISTAAGTGNPYIEPYSEFRGHSQVDETGPDGRVVTTMFSQSDRLKGRPQEVQVKNGEQLLTKQQYTYDWEEQPGGVFPRNEHEAATGLGIYWIYTIREINKIYASTGWSGRKAEYTYGSYGNLTETVESAWNGSAWVNYRRNTVDYYPNTAEGIYLVSLPAAKRSYDSADVLMAASYYFYDSHHSNYITPPSMGKLTAVRTKVEAYKYSQVTYGYDGTWGNRTAVTSYSGYSSSVDTTPSGARTTNTEFDAVYHTYPLSETNPLSQTTAWVYDFSLGVPLSETDPNGAVTSASYDKFGRLKKVIRPGDTSNSPTIKIDYYDLSNPFRVDIQQKITGSTYFTLRRYYDGMGRQIIVEQGSSSPGFTLASTVEYTYDAYGRATSQSMPYGSGETKYYKDSTYDVLGRPLIITMPHIRDQGYSPEISYSYDGLRTTITDANEHATFSTNDIWGRTITVNPPAGPTVTYAYDPLDRMVSASRGGLTTGIDYDLAGRKISMDDPDMGDWSYEYNGLGSLTRQTDARGCITNLVYDTLNRLTTKSYSGAACSGTSSVNYTYDQGANAIGRRTGMTDGSGSTAWEYDSRGRVTLEGKTISGQAFNTQWAYNSADLPASMTYQGGEQVTYTYNGQMMLEGMEGTNIYIESTTYDAAGRMTQRVLGNGMTKAYSYYPWSQQGGRLQNLTASSMQNMSYTYDDAGNVTTISDALAGPQTQTFTYDAVDRVTHASAAGGTYGLYSENYSYNSSTGNLYNKGGVTNTYGDTGHPHAVTERSNGNTYVYDDNGNQTRREIGNDTYDLKYDAENRLVEVKKNSTVIATFAYDGDGKQVKSIINGVTTYYVGQHYQKEGTVVTKYYYAGAERVAMRQGGVLYYIFGDHLGSTAVVKNTQGGKTELRYTAWGTTRYEYGSTPTDRRYTGQREVDDIGLYFYNARWYDPEMGRFIQADTIVPGAGNPQAWDRYAYVNNNPVKYTDPSGHYCIEEDNNGNIIKANCESGELIKNKKDRQGIEFRFDLDDLPGTEGLYYSLSKIANWTALYIDANLEAIAITGAIIGYTSGAAWFGGTPVTGVPGAIIGWSMVQIGVQKYIQIGNYIALSATALSTIADDKAGNNEISLTIGLSSEGVYGDQTFRLSSSSQEAWALTLAGFQGQAQISETSLILQTMAVLNDYGYIPPVPWGTLNWTNYYSWP